MLKLSLLKVDIRFSVDLYMLLVGVRFT